MRHKTDSALQVTIESGPVALAETTPLSSLDKVTEEKTGEVRTHLASQRNNQSYHAPTTKNQAQGIHVAVRLRAPSFGSVLRSALRILAGQQWSMLRGASNLQVLVGTTHGGRTSLVSPESL